MKIFKKSPKRSNKNPKNNKINNIIILQKLPRSRKLSNDQNKNRKNYKKTKNNQNCKKSKSSKNCKKSK